MPLIRFIFLSPVGVYRKYFLSALRYGESKDLVGISAIVPDGNEGLLDNRFHKWLLASGFRTTWLDPSTLITSTWELVGPKVQGNPYKLKEEPVEVVIEKNGEFKKRMLPRHYFILHGSFEISLPDRFELGLDSLRDYIVSNRIEGTSFLRFAAFKKFRTRFQFPCRWRWDW